MILTFILFVLELVYKMNMVNAKKYKVRVELTKSSVVKHQSLAHDAIRRTASNKRAIELEEAVTYCRTNGCRGQKALASGLFPTIGCPKTINRRFDGKVTTERRKAL